MKPPPPIRVPGGYMHLMEVTTTQELHGHVEVELVFKGYFSKEGWEEFTHQQHQTDTVRLKLPYDRIKNLPPSPRGP